MDSGGSSAPAQQTVTQVQQIPEWQQGYAQQNENIAASLAAQPYQQYTGQMIAGFTPDQQAGMNMTQQAASAYQPYQQQATDAANAASTAAQPYQQQAQNLTQAGATTWGQASPQTQASYMDPYAMQALAPQLQQLQTALGQQQLQQDKSSTQAGAFGDARQGVAQSQNNFNANLAQNDLVAQGMNTAYQNAQTAYNTGQQQQLAAGAQENTLGTSAQQNDLNSAQAYSTLGNAAQSQGITGANAVFNSGTQQQQLNQTQLTEAYNNFMNQVNYPTTQLNMRIAALSNSPYTVSNQTSLAPTNATASNVGAFGALAGGLGSLINGGSSGSSSGSIFGSDIRLKKDIKLVGKTAELDLPVYEFKYIWDFDDEAPHVGVMAQDVEMVIPEAVVCNAQGLKMVNYAMVR